MTDISALTLDTIVVTVLDDARGHWYPRVFTPAELASYLRGRAEYEPGEQFRLWDIDADGEPHECEIQAAATDYDENDWATIAVRVVRIDTKEFVLGTYYRVDGRA